MSERWTLHHGDCLDVLRTMPDASVDAVVTDPPYGLGREPDALAMLRDWLDTGHHDVKGAGFMGRQWDAFVPQPAVWREVLRVLKPGGHVLAFAGSRTVDLMGLGLRIAGFELRDSLQWLYGAGFPKSLDVGKAIDKEAGAVRQVVGRGKYAGRESANDFGVISDDAWQGGKLRVETAPATDAARQWNGWGTALKPGHESVILARKPLVGTVAANVQAHGTGALNVDGCRVGTVGGTANDGSKTRSSVNTFGNGLNGGRRVSIDAGRWPANVLLDEEAARRLDEEVGELTTGAWDGRRGPDQSRTVYGAFQGHGEASRQVDKSGPSRFFYTSKAGRDDRELEDGSRSTHPTVKPVDLMRWLVRLVTPPGGVVFDPFTGSGSTGVACAAEGVRFVGIEREAEYHAIATKRLVAAFRQGLLFEVLS